MVEEVDYHKAEFALLVFLHSRGVFYLYVRVKELVDALIFGFERFFEVRLQVTELAFADLL